MNILRHLRPDCIRLELETSAGDPPEDETDAQRAKREAAVKETLLEEFAELLSRSGAIANPSKFCRDLINRERKATTGIAPGIAIPHVRSMQVRTFIMGLGRAAPPGLPFASLDGEPTRLFLLLASPPYEDRIYLQVYREFANLIKDEAAMDGLMAASNPQDVFQVLRGHFR
ncbi:hypothetical protein LBMAG53_18150 [Planctomycetota bacterium]|nr:hypothetical protein LBMAG53_18150 [Planctomycetota bacterium]